MKVKLSQISCYLCKYTITLQDSLIPWGVTVMEKHGLSKHAGEMARVLEELANDQSVVDPAVSV